MPITNSAEQCAPFASTILSVGPALHSFAWRLTRDHAAADDLVQDTLLRAWAAQSQFRSGSNAKAWLFQIARNAFLSGLRRSRRQTPWDPDQHNKMLLQEPTQDDALHARDLNVALCRLSPEQRSAFLLIAREGLSIADASAELGIPSGTVKSRVSRARASILAYLDGDVAPNHERSNSMNRVESGQLMDATRATREIDRAGSRSFRIGRCPAGQ